MSKRLNAATVVACLILSFAPTAALATLTISSDPTSNVSCTSQVCLATATDAVLNVADVTSRLASHNLKIATTGGGANAGNIDIEVALSWSSSKVLTLNTHDSIKFDQPVSVVGTGGLALILGQGDLSFGPNGRVRFWDHASSLAINGQAYTLIGNVADLATGIAASPSASFALADNYDASGDAPIHGAAVTTTFLGSFEGLGNSISNLTLSCADCSSSAFVGLFAQMNGSVENLGLTNVSVDAGTATTGALAGLVTGTVRGDFSTGSLAGSGTVGGLVGGLFGGGDVTRSHSTVAVTTTNHSSTMITAGGLVGECETGGASSTISLSYATGNVTTLSPGGDYARGGGLVGLADGNCAISESFATGAVSGEGSAFVGGGLAGVFHYESGTDPTMVSNSYATGAVSSTAQTGELGGLLGVNTGGKIATSYAVGHVGTNQYTGGLLGLQFTNPPDISHAVWDTQTTGQSECSDGSTLAGCNGLKTRRLKSRLRAGFKPVVWALDPAKNNGYPYLINNPPPQ